MRAPFGWLAPATALFATAIAIAAEGNLPVAVPAAVVAVAAGVLAVAEVGVRSGRPGRPTGLGSPANPKASVRAAFRAARLGREELVMTLDRIERTGRNPDLPGRRIEEMDRVAGLSRPEFRAYVRGRLDELERES